PTPFSDGRRSIFTETSIRNIAKRWSDDLNEIDSESKRLYGENYISLRYEDMLSQPFAELSRLWKFLGVKEISETLEKQLLAEMSSNPDEEWQAQRNEGIAFFLPKGQAGNWRD